jgi:hypothetical protein
MKRYLPFTTALFLLALSWSKVTTAATEAESKSLYERPAAQHREPWRR